MDNVHVHDPIEIENLEDELRAMAQEVASGEGDGSVLIINRKQNPPFGNVIGCLRYDLAKHMVILEGAPDTKDTRKELSDELILATTEMCLEGKLNQVRYVSPYYLDWCAEA